MRRTFARALVGSGIAVVLAALPALATPTIAITSPVEGETVFRSDETFTAAGTATFDTALPADRTFYMRRDGCGTTADNPHLSIVQGTDAGEGCGDLRNGAPYAAFDAGAPDPFADGDSYSPVNGLPVTLDGSKTVRGTLSWGSWSGLNDAGAYTVRFTLAGLKGNQGVVIGTDDVAVTNTPGTAEPVVANYEIAIPAALDRAVLSSLTLTPRFTGATAMTGYINYSGASFLKVPVMDTGLVEVSTSATFSATATRPATLMADGTWIGDLPVPAVGARKVYARAIQNGAKIVSAPVSITVVP